MVVREMALPERLKKVFEYRSFSLEYGRFLFLEFIVFYSLIITFIVSATSYSEVNIPIKMGNVFKHLIVNRALLFYVVGTCFFLFFFYYIAHHFNKKNILIKKILNDIFIFFRLFICVFLGIIIMMQFKWWGQAQLFQYDSFFASTDYILSSVVYFCFWFEKNTKISQEYYSYIYTLVFFVPFYFSVIFSPDAFVRFLTATVSVFIFGGIAYTIFPAQGPLIHGVSVNDWTAEAQQEMISVTTHFRNSAYSIDYGYDAILGAMPSLHVANCFAVALVVKHYSKSLGFLGFTLTGFIWIYSVVTKFHYIIDGLAGLALGYLGYYLAMHPWAVNGISFNNNKKKI